MNDRRTVARIPQKVIHRHRVGGHGFRRVSELVFVRGLPKAILEWIDIGGLRTPYYLPDLDPGKLARVPGARHTYRYGGETVDPRFGDLPEPG
jgi:hypothetical protein